MEELSQRVLSFTPLIRQEILDPSCRLTRSEREWKVRFEPVGARPSAWLNLECLPMPPQRSGARDSLALEPFNQARLIQAFTRRFPTYRDFMEMSLYDEQIGYYSAGKVKFGDPQAFTTFPNSYSPGFGRIAVEQAFSMWESMIAAGDMRKNEWFTILELGAGNGRLAKDMLDTAQQRSLQNIEWATFFSRLQYRIVERSPALQKVQQDLLAPYGDRVKVLSGDAQSTHLLLPPQSIKGLIFTNELIDAFPVHSAQMQEDGTLGVQVMIPYLTQGADGINVERLRKKSDLYKARFRPFLQQEFDDRILISRRDLKKIIVALDRNHEASGSFIHFGDVLIPDRYFPEVRDYRIRHQTSMARLEPGSWLTVNLGMKKFLCNMRAILEKGFLTTIDYKGKDGLPVFFPKGRTDRTHVANCDITTAIDWRKYHREAEPYFLPQVFVSQQALGSPITPAEHF